MKVTPRYDGPSILAFDGEPGDQRAPLIRQRRRLAGMLADLSDEQWCAASRCTGWSVQDVVAHLVGVNAFWRASIVAGLAGTPTRVLVNFDPAATPQLMIEPMRVLAPTTVLAQLVETNEGLFDAVADLDDDGWSMLAESPAGHLPVRLIAHHALWDAWVHERDIARPLGIPTATEPDEVRSALRYAAALSPGLALTVGATAAGEYAVDAHDPDCRFGIEVGDSVVVRDGRGSAGAPLLRGDAVALVEALSLRAPLPATAPGEWRTLLGGLAAAFA